MQFNDEKRLERHSNTHKKRESKGRKKKQKRMETDAYTLQQETLPVNNNNNTQTATEIAHKKQKTNKRTNKIKRRKLGVLKSCSETATN